MGQRGKVKQMKIPPAVYACTESAPQIEGSGGIFAIVRLTVCQLS